VAKAVESKIQGQLGYIVRDPIGWGKAVNKMRIITIFATESCKD
jgi:hypothetical protein